MPAEGFYQECRLFKYKVKAAMASVCHLTHFTASTGLEISALLCAVLCSHVEPKTPLTESLDDNKSDRQLLFQSCMIRHGPLETFSQTDNTAPIC